jgi:hypothetical protein
MTRPGSWCGVVAVLAALSVSSGCASVTLTAANSVSPVLLGPVKTLGDNPTNVSQDYVEMYNHYVAPIEKGEKSKFYLDREKYDKIAKFFYVDLVIGAQAVATMRTIDSSDHSKYGYFTDMDSASSADNPLKTDAAVVEATEGDVNRRVDLTKIECDGHFVYLFLMFKSETACKARGLSPRSP